MGEDAAGKLPAPEYLQYRRKFPGMTNPDRLWEVLSEGFCSKCRFLLQQRLRLLLPSTDTSFFPSEKRRHYPLDFTPESCEHDCNTEVSYHGEDDTPESRHRHRYRRSPERITYSASTEHNAKRWHYPLDFTPESHDHDCNTEVSYHGDNDTPESRHRYGYRRSPERITYSASTEHNGSYSPTEENRKRKRGVSEYSDGDLILDDGIAGVSFDCDDDLSEEQKEKLRFLKVRKQEFVHLERIDGKLKNVLQGLELHSGVFNKEEQKNIVDYVYHLQRKGQRGQLRKRTYSEPRKWMRGKGRVTIQFGCCYNYAMDKKGTPPGIVRDEEVDPLPSLFKKMIKRMVKWHILPSTCVPDSCIVNIYDEGDCIPPHIDHHDFLRPFCTVSFLTESNILFGSRLEILSPGEFKGPVSIPLPKGSVLILSGNGADLAKHCVPSVGAKRISITFRKMDDSKLPYRFLPDLELQRIKPLDLSRSQEGEKKNVKLEEGEIKQRDQHHYDSLKPLDLLSQWKEKEKQNVRVKEGERKQRPHHYDDSVDFSQLQKEEKNVEVKKWERKQRGHHHYYSPKPSSQQSKRQKFQVGV